MAWLHDPVCPGLDDRLGSCLTQLGACADLVAAQLDRHFREPGPDLAWYVGGIARPATSRRMDRASRHWRRHLDRAVELHGRLAAIHAMRIQRERARLAHQAGRLPLLHWLWREARAGRGRAALASLGTAHRETLRFDEGWAEAHAHALADRLWRLRAWLRALHVARSACGERSGAEEDCSRQLGVLLASTGTWISAGASACGRTSVVSMPAPDGTADVRGIEWPARTGGGCLMAGTGDPIGLAVAAGARTLAVTGLGTSRPVLAFDDRAGCQVSAAVFGDAVAELAAAAAHAAGEARREGSRFALGRMAVTAWATTHDGVVDALHLQLDDRPMPAAALA